MKHIDMAIMHNLKKDTTYMTLTEEMESGEDTVEN